MKGTAADMEIETKIQSLIQRAHAAYTAEMERQRAVEQRAQEARAIAFSNLLKQHLDVEISPDELGPTSVTIEGVTFRISQEYGVWELQAHVDARCEECGKPLWQGVYGLESLGRILNGVASATYCNNCEINPRQQPLTPEQKLGQAIADFINYRFGQGEY